MSLENQTIGNFEVGETIDNEENIHYIPVKIEYNGIANVDTKFQNRISTNEDGTFDVEFRGRPLNGQKIKLPTNFNGFVATKAKDTDGKIDKPAADPPGTFKLLSEFKEITYWNWDKKPSKSDAFIKMLDWVNASELIHAPVTTTTTEDDEGKTE